MSKNSLTKYSIDTVLLCMFFPAKNDPRKQLPTAPELTLHFLHTDAQQDDVIPVLKVRLTFGTNQVWPLTQFYSVDFSQSSIGVKKCVFNKRTIKVFVICF